tara:strand:+ start:45952 stop:46509 length:558 start_codon:yes stop_codon:yes gene_type:complete
MKIREFKITDIKNVKSFADLQIGKDYYSESELEDAQLRSEKNGIVTSFVLVDDEDTKIFGLRLAYPPGQWEHGKGKRLSPDLWGYPISELGYFQSLFLAADVQGQGWGPLLSDRALQALRQLKASGILTHCWKESPGNSSFKYLNKVGFKILKEHPDYWIDVDYVCTRDGNPCRCTAIEMILELK